MIDSELWSEFGKWIYTIRRQRDMTQLEAANAIGITRAHLSTIERGQTGVKRDTVLAIASGLGVNAREALSRAGFAPNFAITGMELEDVATGQRVPAEPGSWVDKESFDAAVAQMMRKLDELTQELRESKQQSK